MITLKNSKVQAWIIVFLVWLGAFIASYAQNQLSGMSVQFQEAYGFTGEQYAAIYSASQLLGVFLAFVTGIVSDKIGTRKIILIAGVVVSIACIGRVVGTSFEVQYICNMFSGFTGLFIAVNRSKILGGWFPPAMLALAVGIVSTTTPIANTVGIGLTSLMPSIQFALGTTAFAAILFTVIWFLFGQDASEEMKAAEKAAGEFVEKPSIVKTLIEIAKNPWAWVLSLSAMFLMAGQVPLMAFTPAALQTIVGLEPAAAGGMTTALTIGMGIGSVVSPIIVRAIKAFRPIIAVYGIVTAVVIYIGYTMPVGPIMYVVYFIGGFCLGYLLAIIFTYPVMVFGRDKAATAQGLVQTFLLIGASMFLTNVTIPLAGGANPGTFPTIFMIAAIFLIVGSVLLFVVPDQGKKMVKEPATAKEEK